MAGRFLAVVRERDEAAKRAVRAEAQVAAVERLCVQADERAQAFLGSRYVDVGRPDVGDVRAAVRDAAEAQGRADTAVRGSEVVA